MFRISTFKCTNKMMRDEMRNKIIFVNIAMCSCHFCPRCHCAIFILVTNVPFFFFFACHLCHFYLCHFTCAVLACAIFVRTFFWLCHFVLRPTIAQEEFCVLCSCSVPDEKQTTIIRFKVWQDPGL